MKESALLLITGVYLLMLTLAGVVIDMPLLIPCVTGGVGIWSVAAAIHTMIFYRN